jgi:hypothetical protein
MFETDSSGLDRLLQELDTDLELPTAAESEQQLQELLDSLPTTEQLLAELSDLLDAVKRARVVAGSRSGSFEHRLLEDGSSRQANCLLSVDSDGH